MLLAIQTEELRFYLDLASRNDAFLKQVIQAEEVGGAILGVIDVGPDRTPGRTK